MLGNTSFKTIYSFFDPWIIHPYERGKQEDSYSAIDDPVTTEDSDEIQIDYPVLDDLDLDSTSMLYLYMLLKPKRDWMTSS